MVADLKLGKGIAVVGAGVVGLTAAYVLRRAGHTVRLIADARGERHSSGAAGAIWFPYLAEPRAAVDRWARATYAWLAELHRSSGEAGVIALSPVYAAADDETPPIWSSALPAEAGLTFETGERIPEALRLRGDPRGAWRFRAPLVYPPSHLAWLRSRMSVEEQRVESLDELPDDLIVNCTGARAGALTPDPELRPSFGQVLHAEAGGFPRGCVLVDDRDEDDLFYTIDRGAGRAYVLGGCNLEIGSPSAWNSPEPPAPRKGLENELLERARRVGIQPVDPISRAAWRPVRKTVRVERKGRVLHNYGHGGSGFTLAYGCALEVLGMIDEA